MPNLLGWPCPVLTVAVTLKGMGVEALDTGCHRSHSRMYKADLWSTLDPMVDDSTISEGVRIHCIEYVMTISSKWSNRGKHPLIEAAQLHLYMILPI